MSALENRINALSLKNAVAFDAMSEQWLNPPDDDDEDERHASNCRCYDCEMDSAEAYYDAKMEAYRD